jgi:hypothetical protein
VTSGDLGRYNKLCNRYQQLWSHFHTAKDGPWHVQVPPGCSRLSADPIDRHVASLEMNHMSHAVGKLPMNTSVKQSIGYFKLHFYYSLP